MMPQTEETSNVKLSTPLGTRALDGTPYWVFQGAQDDEGGEQSGAATPSTDNDDDGDDGGDAPDENGLTSGGRKLIEAERNAAKEAKRALAPWKKIEREFGLSPDEIRAKLTAADDETTRAKRDAEAEVTRRFSERIVRTETKALARDLFADPDDALAYPQIFDITKVEVDEDGEVDTKGIEAGLKAILAKKPHLAKKSEDDGDGTVNSFDGGARRTVEKPQTFMSVIRDEANRKRGRR